ncbi:Large proline-rich protein bag6 [Halotydeus destructor]|nr:Large proline-rich protein bag6 [Halotydeus destructor]
MLDINVKTLDSNAHSFSVPDDITVKDFKETIATRVNVPVDKQRIIYLGKVLIDDKKLNEYDVNGKTVHLVQKTPGSRNDGPPNSQSGARQRHPAGQEAGTSGDNPFSTLLGAFTVPQEGFNATNIQQIVQDVISNLGDFGRNATVSSRSSDDGSSVDVHINLGQVLASTAADDEVQDRVTQIHRLLGYINRNFDELERFPNGLGLAPGSVSVNEPNINSSPSTATAAASNSPLSGHVPSRNPNQAVNANQQPAPFNLQSFTTGPFNPIRPTDPAAASDTSRPRYPPMAPDPVATSLAAASAAETAMTAAGNAAMLAQQAAAAVLASISSGGGLFGMQQPAGGQVPAFNAIPGFPGSGFAFQFGGVPGAQMGNQGSRAITIPIPVNVNIPGISVQLAARPQGPPSQAATSTAPNPSAPQHNNNGQAGAVPPLPTVPPGPGPFTQPEFVQLLQQVRETETRFRTYQDRLLDSLTKTDPMTTQEAERNVRMHRYTSRVMHHFGHLYHLMSELFVNVSSPAPRNVIIYGNTPQGMFGRPARPRATVRVGQFRSSSVPRTSTSTQQPAAPTGHSQPPMPGSVPGVFVVTDVVIPNPVPQGAAPAPSANNQTPMDTSPSFQANETPPVPPRNGGSGPPPPAGVPRINLEDFIRQASSQLAAAAMMPPAGAAGGQANQQQGPRPGPPPFFYDVGSRVPNFGLFDPYLQCSSVWTVPEVRINARLSGSEAPRPSQPNDGANGQSSNSQNNPSDNNNRQRQEDDAQPQ